MTSTVFGVSDERLSLAEVTGTVPVRISLSREDVITDDEPHSVFYLVPRSTYPMAFAPAILEEFTETQYVADYGAEKPPNVWLTWENDQEPVVWTTPIGVLADVAIANGRPLPLLFTARVTHAPLPSCVVEATTKKTRELVVSQLYKQSTAIMFEELRPAIDLMKAQIDALRELPDALEEVPTHKFEDAVRQIFANKNRVPLRRWPIVVHRSVRGQRSPLSRMMPVPVGDVPTFGAFLRRVLPELRHLEESALLANCPDSVPRCVNSDTLQRFDHCSSQEELERFGFRAFVSGINPPLGARLDYLMEQLITCDLRLHVVVAGLFDAGGESLTSSHSSPVTASSRLSLGSP